MIQPLEPTSGYAAMSGNDGCFILPNLMWCPGATYSLAITTATNDARWFDVDASRIEPVGGVIDIGTIHLDEGAEISAKGIPHRSMRYDAENDDYYRALFLELTRELKTDETRLDAICKYVATKLNYRETARSFHSPRQILERGSCYCSNLALAMAAITEAGNYPTRTIHLSDCPGHLQTHVDVEVM